MWLDAVRRALDAAAAPAVFFFRDDDAGWDDARLLRLLDGFAAHDVPIDLAVIPTALNDALAAELRRRRAQAPGRLGLHQHGYQHVNHEPQGRKCEFGASRTRDAQFDDLRRGQALLAEALGDVDPLFTPPWNRCTQPTVESLRALGFAALSRDVTAAPLDLAGLRELRVSVDWCKYGTPGAQRAALLGDALAASIRQGTPVGVMLHHAVMQEDDFAQLDALLALLGRSPMAACQSMRRLLALDEAVH